MQPLFLPIITTDMRLQVGKQITLELFLIITFFPKHIEKVHKESLNTSHKAIGKKGQRKLIKIAKKKQTQDDNFKKMPKSKLHALKACLVVPST